MASFGKRIDGPAGRRWLKRKRVGISGVAAFNDQSVAVQVQDLALTGARLLAPDLPPRNVKVILQVGGRSLVGEIRWAMGHHRGLAFDFGRQRARA